MQRLLLKLLTLAFGAVLIASPSLTNIGSSSVYDSAFAGKGGGGNNGGNGNGGNGNGGGNNNGNSGGNHGNGSGFSKGAGKSKHAKAPRKQKAALNASHASAAARPRAAPDANPAIIAAQRLLTDAQESLNAALADPMFNLATFLRLEQAVAKAQTAYARTMNNSTVTNQASEDAIRSRQ